MSRPKAEPRLRSWLLQVQPQGVARLQREPWRAGSAFTPAGLEALRDGESAAQACLRVCRALRPLWPWRVTVALPQSLTPALAVDFGARRVPAAVREACLRTRFAQVHGEPAAAWRLRCGRHSGKAVAFGCDEALAAGLAAVRVGLRPLRIVPAVLLAAMEAPAGTGWFLHPEHDRTVALWLTQGRAEQIVVLAPALPSAALEAALGAWQRRLGLQAAGTPLLGSLPGREHAA